MDWRKVLFFENGVYDHMKIIREMTSGITVPVNADALIAICDMLDEYASRDNAEHGDGELLNGPQSVASEMVRVLVASSRMSKSAQTP